MLTVTKYGGDLNTSVVYGSILLNNHRVGEYCLWGTYWRWDEDGRQIGYRMHFDMQGLGIMTRALRLIVKQVPSEYHRLIIKSWNLASIRVAEKAGFKEYVGLDTRETYWRL